MKKALLFTLLATFLLVGCASTPSEVSSASQNPVTSPSQVSSMEDAGADSNAMETYEFSDISFECPQQYVDGVSDN